MTDEKKTPEELDLELHRWLVDELQDSIERAEGWGAWGRVNALQDLKVILETFARPKYQSNSFDPETRYDATPPETKKLFVWFLRRVEGNFEMPERGRERLRGIGPA